MVNPMPNKTLKGLNSENSSRIRDSILVRWQTKARRCFSMRIMDGSMKEQYHQWDRALNLARDVKRTLDKLDRRRVG